MTATVILVAVAAYLMTAYIMACLTLPKREGFHTACPECGQDAAQALEHVLSRPPPPLLIS